MSTRDTKTGAIINNLLSDACRHGQICAEHRHLSISLPTTRHSINTMTTKLTRINIEIREYLEYIQDTLRRICESILFLLF
jgi:hypothetical protein